MTHFTGATDFFKAFEQGTDTDSLHQSRLRNRSSPQTKKENPAEERQAGSSRVPGQRRTWAVQATPDYPTSKTGPYEICHRSLQVFSAARLLTPMRSPR